MIKISDRIQITVRQYHLLILVALTRNPAHTAHEFFPDIYNFWGEFLQVWNYVSFECKNLWSLVSTHGEEELWGTTYYKKHQHVLRPSI